MTRDIDCAIREAVADATFNAYDKVRELVGYSANASHVIEAQMQEEFPDRAFVPSTQQRGGSRMDGGNMRMPLSPNQIRKQAVTEEREACALIASRKASTARYGISEGMALDIEVAIRARSKKVSPDVVKGDEVTSTE